MMGKREIWGIRKKIREKKMREERKNARSVREGEGDRERISQFCYICCFFCAHQMAI